jgi:hypothetical protein
MTLKVKFNYQMTLKGRVQLSVSVIYECSNLDPDCQFQFVTILVLLLAENILFENMPVAL